jgi:hypothetical protein
MSDGEHRVAAIHFLRIAKAVEAQQIRRGKCGDAHHREIQDRVGGLQQLRGDLFPGAPPKLHVHSLSGLCSFADDVIGGQQQQASGFGAEQNSGAGIRAVCKRSSHHDNQILDLLFGLSVYLATHLRYGQSHARQQLQRP